MWKDLTLQEKAEIMKMSVANGVTDINDIKAIYDNETHNYQLGGYKQWKNAIAKYKHLDVDNDPTYDYEGFYNSDPARAWGLLDEDPNAHFVDNFKTAQHPTFSKESNYSGKFHPIYNPQGIEGGTWGNRSFTLPKDWQKGSSLQDRISYLEDAENEGVTLYGPNGELPVIYSNDIWGGVLPNIDIYNKALGGHLYKGGGSKRKKPSSTINYHLEDAQAFINELVAAGVDPILAIGVGGNVWVESRFNPEASNNINGGHWGLVQNDANIRKHIVKYYGDYSRNSQMQFLKDGLTGQIKGAKNAKWLQQRFNDYRRHATGVKDASIAAKHFHDDYEKSRNEMVADRMRAASFYQTGIATNPTISAYHKMYGKPDLSISNDMLYNPAQELKWTNITPTIQQTPWYNNINSNLVMEGFTPQVKPITPIPIKERFPIEEVPDIAPLLSSILPDQRMPSYQQITVPTYQSPIINFNEPYLLFGR